VNKKRKSGEISILKAKKQRDLVIVDSRSEQPDSRKDAKTRRKKFLHSASTFFRHSGVGRNLTAQYHTKKFSSYFQEPAWRQSGVALSVWALNRTSLCMEPITDGRMGNCTIPNSQNYHYSWAIEKAGLRSIVGNLQPNQAVPNGWPLFATIPDDLTNRRVRAW